MLFVCMCVFSELVWNADSRNGENSTDIIYLFYLISVLFKQANQRDVIAAVTGIVNCLDCLTLKWDG